jgi:pantothenate kinase, type III
VILAIDARNKDIYLGFLELGSSGERRWLSKSRLGVLAGRRADDYALLFSLYADRAAETAGRPGGAHPPRVEGAWLSSVVPSLTRELAAAIRSAFGIACSVVGPGTKSGVKIRTDSPSEVGSDLVCEALAARALVRGPAIVVDFNSVIAFTAVGKGGELLGVAISPGVATSQAALRASAALLPEVSLAGPSAPAIGRNTAQSVRAGLLVGCEGMVERITRRQSEEMVAMGEALSPEEVEVIATGDEEGQAIAASLGLGRFVPDLVLEGLAILACRSASPAIALA